jgi:hypothetical protein
MAMSEADFCILSSGTGDSGLIGSKVEYASLSSPAEDCASSLASFDMLPNLGEYMKAQNAS